MGGRREGKEGGREDGRGVGGLREVLLRSCMNDFFIFNEHTKNTLKENALIWMQTIVSD